MARLGKGGGGEVWAVRDRHGGARYALKLLAAGSTEREMAALVREAVALSGLEGLGVPRVVRFGRLPDEVRAETEAFGADLVALAAPLHPRLGHRALTWYLEDVTLGSAIPVILLPVTAPTASQRSRDAVAVPAR